MNRVIGDDFRQLTIFFADIAKALRGEGIPVEEHDDSLGPRSRPSSLADAE